MRIRFHPLALRELHRAAEFYERHRIELGDTFYSRVADGLDLIKQVPNAQPSTSRRCRRLLLRQFPYAVIYAHPPPDPL